MEKKNNQIIFLKFIFLPFLLLAPAFVDAASLSINPLSAKYSVGERAVIKIVVSGETSLNAVAGSLLVPPIFSIESISKTGSILNFWVTEPFFSKTAGAVHFEGVALSAFQGSIGTVLTINLRAVKEGSGSVIFQSGQILANDGQGTDITGALNKGIFVVEPGKIEPVQDVIIEVEPPSSTILTAPAITKGQKEGLDTIFGASKYPNADVLLTFVSVGGSKIFITGTTDSEGYFNLTVPQVLRDGPYSISAVIVLDNNTHSLPSNTLTIEVGGLFHDVLIWKIFSYFWLLILLLLLVYLIWRKYFGSRSKIKTLLKKEVAEAEDMLHKSFNILKEDYRKENFNELKEDLNDAENFIEKEIKDIKSIPIDDKK